MYMYVMMWPLCVVDVSVKKHDKNIWELLSFDWVIIAGCSSNWHRVSSPTSASCYWIPLLHKHLQTHVQYPINSLAAVFTLINAAATTTPWKLHKSKQNGCYRTFRPGHILCRSGHRWGASIISYFFCFIHILIIWSLISQLTSTKDWI